MDRPARRNALSRGLVAALHQAIQEAGATDGVRVVVLAGEGPAFCAGADIGEFASSAEDGLARSDAEGIVGLLGGDGCLPLADRGPGPRRGLRRRPRADLRGRHRGRGGRRPLRPERSPPRPGRRRDRTVRLRRPRQPGGEGPDPPRRAVRRRNRPADRSRARGCPRRRDRLPPSTRWLPICCAALPAPWRRSSAYRTRSAKSPTVVSQRDHRPAGRAARQRRGPGGSARPSWRSARRPGLSPTRLTS